MKVFMQAAANVQSKVKYRRVRPSRSLGPKLYQEDPDPRELAAKSATVVAIEKMFAEIEAKRNR